MTRDIFKISSVLENNDSEQLKRIKNISKANKRNE